MILHELNEEDMLASSPVPDWGWGRLLIIRLPSRLSRIYICHMTSYFLARRNWNYFFVPYIKKKYSIYLFIYLFSLSVITCQVVIIHCSQCSNRYICVSYFLTMLYGREYFGHENIPNYCTVINTTERTFVSLWEQKQTITEMKVHFCPCSSTNESINKWN